MYTVTSAARISSGSLVSDARKRCGRALERSLDARGHSDLLAGSVDRGDRVAQRVARREIERNRHRGELALMIDGQRRRARLEMGEGAQRHLAAGVRANVDVVERVRIALKLRRDFEHHVILIELREHRRHLPLPEGVVQRVVDQIRRDAEARSGQPIDHDMFLPAVVLLIGRDVAQRGNRLELVDQLVRSTGSTPSALGSSRLY